MLKYTLYNVHIYYILTIVYVICILLHACESFGLNGAPAYEYVICVIYASILHVSIQSYVSIFESYIYCIL